MNSSYEPKCTLEQSTMLYKLGLREYKPTTSLAKNWLYEKYGIWIQTTVYAVNWDTMIPDMFDCTYFLNGCKPLEANHIFKNPNPHTAESDCLTEVLKKLTNEKSNS